MASIESKNAYHRVVDDKAVDDKAVDDKAVDDKAVDDKAVGDKAVGDKAVGDTAVGDTAVGDTAVDDTAAGDLVVTGALYGMILHVPLFSTAVKLINKKNTNHITGELYALQYSDFPTLASIKAANIDITKWINIGFIDNLITDLSTKTTTKPFAKLITMPGAYFVHYDTTTIYGRALLKYIYESLNIRYYNDSSWKRVIVFDNDYNGFTLYN